MTNTLDTRKAALDREWRPLTDEHTAQLRRAEESFEQFEAGQTVDPIALVGAYRSGKTQLLYHLFRESWERGIPAFYIGDSGAMLADFAASDTPDLNEWLQAEVDRQLRAYAKNDHGRISWFPNVDSKQKEAFVAAHASTVQQSSQTRTALFFDEVEQSYSEYIRIMDKDDDNPLRKINDGLQDSIKVWSFGMISAYEFIGEADWGRMREVRIPPLQVSDVRSLLEEQRPETPGIANLLWWLARGRTGLIIKLLDDLPSGKSDVIIDWIRDLAETRFRDTQLLNNRWTELDRHDWETAIRALTFDPAGLDAWQISDSLGLSATECQYLAVDILKSEFIFDETSAGQTALELLDRNLKRAFTGLAVSSEQLFPAGGLADQQQADALLSLVSDLIVSFEPTSDARSVALEALEVAEGRMHKQWQQHAYDRDTVETETVTAAPSVVQATFPPIAMNPERVSSRTTDDLRADMDRGLEVVTGNPAEETVDIRLCPTEETFEAELSAVTNQADITAPTVLVVPEGDAFERGFTAVDAYMTHDLLRIESYRSSRFWTFILHLHGRLAAEASTDSYRIDESTLEDVLTNCSDREVRNTIETLYDQVRQVAIDHLTTFEDVYRATYSLPDAEALLWEDPRLEGTDPYWSSSKFVESTVALSYLPVLGPDYDPDRSYAALHEVLLHGLNTDLVEGGRGGFRFKSYLESLFTQNGYSSALAAERDHYRVDGELAPAVQHTRDALTALARQSDLSTLTDSLDDPDVEFHSAQVPVASLDGLGNLGQAFVRALLVAGLTSGSESAIEMGPRLEELTDDITATHQRVTDCIKRVDALNEQLHPPNSVSVGTWFDIETARLDEFVLNLETLRTGVDDLSKRTEQTTSAGPLAYHYWFLITRYLEVMNRRIDAVESTIANTSLATINETIELYDDLYERLETAPFVAAAFDDREALLAQLEAYGNQVFDLQGHLEQTSVAIPDDGVVLQQVDEFDEQLFITDPDSDFASLDVPGDNGALRQLNQIVNTHKQHLITLQTDLNSIESHVSDIQQYMTTSQDSLLALLSGDASQEMAND